MVFRSAVIGLLALAFALPAAAQNPSPLAATQGLGPLGRPETLEILGVSVEGVEGDYTQSLVQQASGLEIGQTVVLPGDPAFGDAIRSIYRLGMYSDVKVVEERRVGNGVYLAIRVREVPRLSEYRFEGIKKGQRKDLRKEVPLITRSPVRPGAVERTKQVIREFYAEKGRPLAEVEVERTENEAENTAELVFRIDPGPKVEVGEIVIEGNEELSDRKIRKALETKQDAWWRFWSKAKLNQDEYAEDLNRIVELYNERGYYDARVLRDTVFVDRAGKPEYVVNIEVEEGDRYFVRDIEWEGNTVYTDDFLSTSLGVEPGDAYNSAKLEENLYANKRSTDVSSLYMNRGYMRFQVQPTIRVVGDDSLDLVFDVFEGDTYEFGTIDIAGNQKTKEHVIRRELYTVPGQTFSRDAIQESIRRLMQLNYFTQESLAQGPGVNINEENKTVDLAYNLEETGSDQLELSGTWGRFGLVLQLRFGFNNFSIQNVFDGDAWRPLPTGDGQKLSVGIQTNGTYYQQYSLSFTEPWFRGKPQPIGTSLSFSRISRNPFSSVSTGSLITGSARFFYERRLKVPDDKFSYSVGTGYQYFDNDNWISTLPDGASQELTFTQALGRNSTDHPYFPTAGSTMRLSLDIAPPLGGTFIQYHKWRFKNNWNMPLARKLTLSVGADYAYIGSITGDPVDFERFVVGGSPFETSGSFSLFGKDVVYLRGYPFAVIGPRRDGDPVGGRILNKYTSELRWMAVQTPQLQAAPYLFLDAANTYSSFGSYNPASLYRSAGVGTRLFLPILGMVELVYGYNFDSYDPIRSGQDGERGWSFQFSLGQGFGN